MIAHRRTAIDLFAGAGGMTLGLKQAGYNVLGAIDINHKALQTYKLNHPEVAIWLQDIRSVDTNQLMKSLDIRTGELTILGGCPPCQGFSSLRTRNKTRSFSDDRNDLVYEFIRFAEALMPEVVMIENVPNLAHDERILVVQDELRKLGYFVSPESVEVLDVANYGVPQRRKRMILLAGRDSLLSFAAPSASVVTVRDAIGDLQSSALPYDRLHNYEVKRTARVKEVIEAIPQDGGSRASLPKHLQLRCHERTDGFRDVYGRMAWDRPAPTITSGCFNPSKGRFLHPVENRAITIREASLLQTFPIEYKFPVELGRQAIADQLGNALPPEFIRRQALHISHQLEQMT